MVDAALRVPAKRRPIRWSTPLTYGLALIVAGVAIGPVLYVVLGGFRTNGQLAARPAAWPSPWIFSNYQSVLASSSFWHQVLNSTLTALATTAGVVVLGVMAAFALSRMRFWGSATLATGVFLTYLIPETLLFIPMFKMFALVNEHLGIQLINRWWVLLLLYPTLTVPFCTWIMIGYFASIPKELDEAALMDGANYRQILTRVFIPVALPGLIAATIFAFTVSWAQFLYPLAFTTSADQLVLPVGIITSLIKGDVFNWGQIMTGALLGAAPPLIIYAFLMDYYIAGLTAGATKG